MSKKEILIVEDEETLLKLESVLLSARGYQVKGVGDGRAALDSVAHKKPDLVLLDIMLPEVDGFEVCRQIKENAETKHIPVIMLTAKKSSEDIAKGERVGADWYMTKPFKSAMLVETVQRFLAGPLKPVFCNN